MTAAAPPATGRGVAGERLLWVDNSNETFAPSVGGAIATCGWHVINAAAGDADIEVVTPERDAEPYPWPRLTRIRSRPGGLARVGGPGERADRAVRRLTGWAHPGQAGYARQVVAHARATRPQVVICNNDPEVAVALSRALPGTRVLHWFHNLELAEQPWRRRFAVEGRVVPVAVSGYLARAVEMLYRLSPGTVTVAYNGVDLDRFHPVPPVPGRPVIGYLGRVAVEKGVDTFLEAVARLDPAAADVLIIGDTNWGFSDGGPYGRRVADLVSALEAGGTVVHRTGHLGRDEVPVALRRCAVQVVAARWDEPFGLTTLEGLASGLAVVATATGGTPEVVGDAGVLVPRDDPATMAAAIAVLLDDPERRRALQRAARERAETFGWDRTWAALRAVAG